MEKHIVTQKNIITTVNSIYCTLEHNQPCEIPITIEHTVKLYCNEKLIYTFHCLPQQLQELAVGYLFARNYISTRKEIKTIRISDDKMKIHITTQHNTIALPTNTISNLKIHKSAIFARMHEFENLSATYKSTRATHTVALANANEIKIYFEDISRHAALDKLLGHCLLNDLLFNNYALLLSCRVTQSIAENIADKGIPIIASLGGVTDIAIKLCNDKNITLTGFARNRQIHIFTNHKHIEIN